MSKSCSFFNLWDRIFFFYRKNELTLHYIIYGETRDVCVVHLFKNVIEKMNSINSARHFFIKTK